MLADVGPRALADLLAYLLLRRYGGPDPERLAAAVALFGMANVPFVYWSVNVWRTVHPKTTVVPSLPPALPRRSGWSIAAFLTPLASC
jgi:heme exporter protein C